jgi:hypothetical protein
MTQTDGRPTATALTTLWFSSVAPHKCRDAALKHATTDAPSPHHPFKVNKFDQIHNNSVHTASLNNPPPSDISEAPVERQTPQ